MKKVLGILDICSIGGTSTNTFILSTAALGNEPVVIPTYLFSYQTEMNKTYCKVNNTKFLEETLKQYIKDKITFDGILIGYVDEEQIKLLTKYLPNLSKEDTKIVLDPVVLEGDSKEKIDCINELSKLANFVTPNIFECSVLNLDKDKTIKKGLEIKDKIGFEYNNTYYMYKKINKEFYGCGDLFASLFINLLVNNVDVYEALSLSSKALYKVLKNTTTREYTIDVENNLKKLCKLR